MNNKLLVGTMRLAIIAGLLLMIADGNTTNAQVEERVTFNFTKLELAREETLRIDLTNRMVLKRKGDDPFRVYALVKLYDSTGQVIAQSQKVSLPRNQLRPVTFNRSAITLPGEPRTGRLQIRVAVEVEVQTTDRNTIYVNTAGGGVWASLKVIDNVTGKATAGALEHQGHVYMKFGVSSVSNPDPGSDKISKASSGPTQRSVGTVADRMASFPSPQLEFVGKEAYEINGAKGTRDRLAVTNRASIPDSLWHPAPNLPPCANNENAARTWVEIFGSPGDKRLNGFCALSSSEDLAQIWFAVPAGEKGSPCVYIVMTDRQTGKKYMSNRVCSRSFTVVTGRLKGGSQRESTWEKHIDLNSWGVVESRYKPLVIRKRIDASTPSSKPRVAVADADSAQPTNRLAKMAKPDLVIKQFLFPPTNDKALRVQVANTGNAASGAFRLLLTVRKINGVPAGRQTHVNVPALAVGAEVWLVIDAKSILPVNVSLKSTTFKLNADATGIVAESNEANNEVWHNL